jgi:hypothetical protein
MKSPGNRAGVSAHQAVLEWGTDYRRLYALEHAGKLVGIHVGNRVWYSRAQLVALLGEPVNGTRPPALKRRDNGADVSGRQLSWDDLSGGVQAA